MDNSDLRRSVCVVCMLGIVVKIVQGVIVNRTIVASYSCMYYLVP